MKNFKKNFKKIRISFSLTQEELAKKISLETFTVSQYEFGRNKPSIKVLKNIIEFYNISFDYLLLADECVYSKNLRLLKLAKKLDAFSKTEARNNIEATTKNLLGEKINNSIQIKQDSEKINLSKDFHSNLKVIRKLRGLTQNEIAEYLNISRPVVSLYEKKIYPSIEKIVKLAKLLNISIHALVTGEKLYFNFRDGYFGEVMLLADYLLPIEEHNILIKLMKNIIKNVEIQAIEKIKINS